MKYHLTAWRKLPQGLHHSSRPFSPPSFPPIEVLWARTLLLHRLRHCAVVRADRVAGYGRLAGKRGYPLGFIASISIYKLLLAGCWTPQCSEDYIRSRSLRAMTPNLGSSFILYTYNPATLYSFETPVLLNCLFELVTWWIQRPIPLLYPYYVYLCHISPSRRWVKTKSLFGRSSSRIF